MFYRSVNQLNRDLARWSHTFPSDIVGVVGIPRSGMLPATLLALHLHLPLADLESLIQGRWYKPGERMSGGGSRPGTEAGRVLVLDDSVNKGGALKAARERILSMAPHLDGRIIWASPYVTGSGKALVDLYYEVVPQPRVFQWNVLHHSGLVDACMDIDGVLCPDPGADDDDGQRYAAFLDGAPCLHVPASEVGWLVTSRLERYRPQTEEWLRRHGIRYRQLLMHPAHTRAQRLAEDNHGERKAEHYKRTGAWLFIESDIRQARTIADIAKRPVYCTDAHEMIYPGMSVGTRPLGARTLSWRAREGARQSRKRIQYLLRKRK
ncbi:hypothetical protein BJF86_02520 [Serinicoccus sp. CNJ-927]|uniref:phosphoribosyltransferase family protein n=1 Tax=Serinicoccus sp. CNJ-927 TaxID=1904970 RepID=UPI0009615BE7|nr:phosphoribosyltransferase family protein [Serinicoccus sp. CNJ-927]OLT41900.1 hypothetical protein BJF86_02520 [Serinicoccus sp. CNJ-927]